MLSTKKMQDQISLILLFGTLLSAALVLFGGIWYLFQHGSDNMQIELMQSNQVLMQPYFVWSVNFIFSATGSIKLGLFILVATQILRVALLCIFYLLTRDYWFTAFSSFILCILIVSFFFR